jgi:hypothetical protein
MRPSGPKREIIIQAGAYGYPNFTSTKNFKSKPFFLEKHYWLPCTVIKKKNEFLYPRPKASLNGEFHRPDFQDVKLWYEINVSLNA